ncbi:MAG: hypothetical protein DRQ42_00625 [Gammaproteobacteria bacterium]|nr:MAG: hypothetical protein DRQ42_00625 [Gammaproteobacteria bacterium]
MIKDRNYREDRRIQFNRLHINARDQAEIYGDYADACAKAETVLENEESRLASIKAERYQIISGKPEAYGIKRLTDTAIDSVILTEDAYKKQAATTRSVKYKANRFKRSLRAFEHRKDMLEVLSRLYVSGYFSTPRIHQETEQNSIDKETDERYRNMINNKDLKPS